MAHPQWTRLDRDSAHRVLEHLSASSDAIVFSKSVTEVSWRALPFYTNYRLYRLVNYATMPTFTMLYLSNDEEFIAIDGTQAPIYAVNRKDPIHLTEINVVPYLEFFFANVQGGEGDVFLIKDPAAMPFMDILAVEQQQSIIGCFRALRIAADPMRNLEVSATVYYGGSLVSATILVTSEGKISFHDQSLLLSGIHFPESPYAQTWLEG